MEEPTGKQCSELASELRPNFEVFQPAKEAAAMLDAELLSFTEEQYVALDLMSRSDRAVFTGPAGTGKTVLAVEAARRAHSNGERVRLICFNNLLGNHLKEQVSDLGDGIFAGSLGQFMREIVGPAGMPDSPSQQFWDVELPEQARNALLDDPDSDMTVDQLIIDEGQDLLKPAFLDFFDLVLERGLAYGKWRMFGDFDNQMIFPQGSLSLDEFLTGISKQGSNVSIGSLDINCRNTPRIIDSVRIFAGLKPGYKTVLRPDNQQDCKAFFYDSDDEQQALLASVLQSYREDKIRSDDTVVLSPKTDCASRRLSTPPWNQRLVPIDKWSTGHIPYTTIHRFKGLERPAVIVTDINDVGQEEAKSLLYIALTRGTARVTWLASKDVQKMLVNALTSEAGA
jgi:superfamily I DNA and RNA helicase